MNAKMYNNLQALLYIKTGFDKHTAYADMRQTKMWLQNSFYIPDTARTVNGIHNTEVSTVLKEMSTVPMLLCINSTQIELKYSMHKTRIVIIQIHV